MRATRPALSVFDPLMLGLQKFNSLGVESEEIVRQVGGEPFQHIAAYDVFCDHNGQATMAVQRFRDTIPYPNPAAVPEKLFG